MICLVDPDNRRPVNYAERLSYLQEIQRRCQTDLKSLLCDLKATRYDGRLKLFLITRTLAARQQYRDVFEAGDYHPIAVEGERADHIVAFARTYQGASCITIVPRFLASLIAPDQDPYGKAIWGDTALVLPAHLKGPWRDALSDLSHRDQPRVPISKILQTFPVALLVRARNR